MACRLRLCLLALPPIIEKKMETTSVLYKIENQAAIFSSKKCRKKDAREPAKPRFVPSLINYNIYVSILLVFGVGAANISKPTQEAICSGLTLQSWTPETQNFDELRLKEQLHETKSLPSFAQGGGDKWICIVNSIDKGQFGCIKQALKGQCIYFEPSPLLSSTISRVLWKCRSRRCRDSPSRIAGTSAGASFSRRREQVRVRERLAENISLPKKG